MAKSIHSSLGRFAAGSSSNLALQSAPCHNTIGKFFQSGRLPLLGLRRAFAPAKLASPSRSQANQPLPVDFGTLHLRYVPPWRAIPAPSREPAYLTASAEKSIPLRLFWWQSSPIAKVAQSKDQELVATKTVALNRGFLVACDEVGLK